MAERLSPAQLAPAEAAVDAVAGADTDPVADRAAIAAQLLACFDAAETRAVPWRHWLLAEVLPAATADAVAGLPLPAPAPGVLAFDGTRAGDNPSRLFFNPEGRARFPVVDAIAAAFDGPAVRARLSALTGVDLAPHALRIEYCQDVDGFWLEPHCDIRVKKLTMLVYLSRDPALADAGTDLYDGPETHWGTAPYAFDAGLIFVPGDDTWHGFAPRPIRGLRQSLIVNFVDDTWRARHELAAG
jgi:hypothetical protein